MVAGPAVQVVITNEPPADVVAGAAFQVVVADEDSLGFVNTSYSGSATIALIDDPGNTTLGGTLTVPFQSGVATFSNLSLGAAADGYLLQVTSGTLVPATTSAIDVIPVQLDIATQPPGDVVAGNGFGLVVDAESSGQLDSSFNARGHGVARRSTHRGDARWDALRDRIRRRGHFHRADAGQGRVRLFAQRLQQRPFQHRPPTPSR